ncbi:MAG: hypothetical protein M3011_06125 [Actinomycetota bacterium]|nr:hypothetical protein [Actinomycetota bacterium]
MAALLCGAGLAGCGGTGHHASAAKAPPKFSHARFIPANFVSPIAGSNAYLPLRPGLQSVRKGTTQIGHRAVPHIVVSTVTDVIRRIDGVRAVAVIDQDVDAGQITQQSIDWRAQDRAGNIWSVGSYTEEYEGGRFSIRRDAWLAGVDGAKAGLMMPVNASPQMPPWTIARPPQSDPDVARAVARRTRLCVSFNCYTSVLTVREGKASALNNELKYYAPGVGQILNTPMVFSHHKDVEELVNLIQLTPRGLAEISAEVLKLDRHARITAKGTYGQSPAARRAG